MNNSAIPALRAYLKSLPDPAARAAFAKSCGTSLNYLRKAISKNRFKPGAGLCAAIERESRGAIRCEQLRPDVDWNVIRADPKPPKENPA